VIRSDDDVMIVDHGPLGMPPSHGHGHADALSIALMRNGHDVLIDPGTYTYTGDPAWRTYFRGTAAHNTVTVDHQDQAVQETAFQWSRPYETELVRSEPGAHGGVDLLARHNGYRRLGVEHWRGVAYLPRTGWLVWDCLTGPGSHCLDLHWHLGVDATLRADGAVFSDLKPSLRLTVFGGDLAIFRGQVAPILGWRSRSYNQREPCSTLRIRFEGTLPHEFVTRLGPDQVGIDDAVVTAAVAGFRQWVADAET
jgi:hypothetical protein